MLSFVRKMFSPRSNPIGVDFGTDCLRLAQVRMVQGEYRLTAAASADVPAHIRADAEARWDFFVDTTRDLLAQGNFSGRQAILSLPASNTHIQHLRLPKLDEETLKKTLPFELRGNLSIDPNAALLRHVVAGDVFQDQDPRMELIVMAARRDYVERYLALASRAKLDVVGMNVEPRALVDCFGHIYRRKTDADATHCFVDIGSAATRVLIARDGRLLFARTIPIAGDQFARAVAGGLSMDVSDARMLRIKLASIDTAPEDRNATPVPPAPEEEGFALLGAAMASAEKRRINEGAPDVEDAPDVNEGSVLTVTANDRWGKPQAPSPTDDPRVQARRVEQLVREPLDRLVEEIDLCRRYYESTFPSRPVDRLIFVGGESRHRGMCQHIARELGLAAQIGDPLVRMGRVSEIGIESGIDRRQPQPAWAVAIGLSLGPTDEGAGEVKP